MLEGSCHCGAVRWTFAGRPDAATSCNCTVCRRYGVLWAYGYEDDGVAIHADAATQRGYERAGGDLTFHFCLTCGCVTHWRGRRPGRDGRRRIAVNLRLAEPGEVADLPVRRFDGLKASRTFPPTGAASPISGSDRLSRRARARASPQRRGRRAPRRR